MSRMSTPVEVFCSYAQADEPWLHKLESHLALLKQLGLITVWHHRLVTVGTNWQEAIDAHLETAQVILLLISADFLSSEYCYGIEMRRALEREKAGEVRVLPILLRYVDWKDAPFTHLPPLPTDARPVASWQDQDAALADVVRGVRQIIEEGLPISTRTPHRSWPSHPPLHPTNQPITTIQHAGSVPSRDQQNRARFLVRLRTRYQDLLAQSLQGAVQMSLELAGHPDAVAPPAQLLYQSEQHPPQPLPAGTTLAQVYSDAGQELLVLGEPGAGKSTLLLELALIWWDRLSKM